MKKILFLLSSIVFSLSLQAQLKSPDEYLGYELGSRFTPHYRIVGYFDQAAAALPGQVKLERYGLTNEGRELLIAIVASPENLARIDEIRKNNLRLTGLLNDKPGDVNAPVIVWLSYNVHGNEPSSSEVAMKTLYALLNPDNTQTKQWLKNTVVIIDPCMNPDGRDRYVNWYTQMAGRSPNANPDSREHSEPWPGGRTNHYNFDLNRDWAWQTQLETKQRMRKYNEWMPQIHCDYHEQYPNNPYYFAPAAEPFHEVITPWQRELQTRIGKNHARYFDANGWLYFTREVFDLLYPSYGDTYPTFNGAVGMTYEQAGHSPGGLAIAKNDGDTLTLRDRIAHHFTTSMSTIEVASQQAARVMAEFKKFFDEARTKGSGPYKSYLVTASDKNRIVALQQLLAANEIRFGSYTGGAARGYNYFSGREENVITDRYSIVINAQQPKATLVQVLFEPQSKLSDSATYDITAWSLPYVYGLKTYALQEGLTTGTPLTQADVTPAATSYGYLVNYSSFNDAVLLAALLQEGFRVRYAERDFAYNDKFYNSGTLILLRSGNEQVFASLPALLVKYHASAEPVESGFMQTGADFGSEKIHQIKKPGVAIVTGNAVSASAAGELWYLFDQQLKYPVSLINQDDLGAANWKNIDVLILPDGNYKMLTDKDAGGDLRNWLKQGGKLIALEGATAQLAAGDWGLKLKKAGEDSTAHKPYANLHKYVNRERDGIVNNIPGAIYKVELDNTHPLAFGYPGFYFTLKQNDNIFEFAKEGWNVGVLKREEQVAGFVGSKLKDKLKDGTLIGVMPSGNGSIIFFADDPVFRNFWENGKLLLSNAVFLAGQ